MIRWFTQNGVAANLLAAITIVAGLFVANTIKLELFPNLELGIVRVNVPYPGAAPVEVENGIVELIEDRVNDIDGVKKMTGIAAEGSGAVLLEIERGYDATDIADKAKVRIDAIDNFPEQAEEPQVEKLTIREEVISVAVMGNASDATLKEIAERVRDELKVRSDISQVELDGIRDYEISINVSETALRRHDLTFDAVASAVRDSSVDIPGGAIKSRGGEILLRTVGKAYRGGDFKRIPLITGEDGTRVTIGDVAEVNDGFVDDPLFTRFNGERAVVLQIFAVGDQSALEVADDVKRLTGEIEQGLPDGVRLEAFRDFTYYLKGRLQMLIKNGIYGLILVFAVLTLFLRPSLAFFVMLGIPISFLGAILVLPFLDITINLASLFGFILVLGIVVDDAIIVGESVFTSFQKHGGPGVEASVEGTRRVAIPVTFAVLTTAVAFLPILTIPGFFGKFFYPIPVVVIATVMWSLVQSKLVLPYHLTLCRVGKGGERSSIGWLRRQQRKVADGLERFVENVYRPTLQWALKLRYLTVAGFIAVLVVILGLFLGERLRFIFIPTVPSDYIVGKLVMPEGTPVELTERGIEQMHEGMEKLIQEMKEEGLGNPFQNFVITIGAQPFADSGGPMGDTQAKRGTHVAELAVELVKSEDRIGGGPSKKLLAPELAKRWRELMGTIPGAKEVSFNANAAGGSGMPIDIELSGRDFDRLQSVSEEIQDKLGSYDHLFDIKDSYASGKREIKLKIKSAAQVLGLRQADLGRQVRAAFYGIEAQRIQRDRDDVKVMVRYPPDERDSVENLEDLRIRTPDGRAIPFYEVADYEIGEGYSTITRVDRRRVINVTADADKEVADMELIKEDLQRYLSERIDATTGVTWSFAGEAREQADIFASLRQMVPITLFMIYALLAVPLRSYLQPIIVMVVIPFGLIGAIGGHILLGRPFSLLSVLGFVALAGVVVNDSLVLVDYINTARRAGKPLRQAIQDSGALRFRPIVLTSLTTFVGLLPVLFETSLQAQFLVPMAISLSFGVLFATLITLLLVPSFYFILEDIRKLPAATIRRIRGNRSP